MLGMIKKKEFSYIWPFGRGNVGGKEGVAQLSLGPQHAARDQGERCWRLQNSSDGESVWVKQGAQPVVTLPICGLYNTRGSGPVDYGE